MYKKFLLVLTIITLISLVFYKYLSDNSISIEAFTLLKNSKLTISEELLNMYKSGNLKNKTLAEKKIKEICLNNLGYYNWLEYIDYIKVNIYQSNVVPNDKEELIVGLNLSKDIALICVFTNEYNDFTFLDKIEGLAPIENIRFIKIPEKKYNFIIPYQILDERLGAFFYEEYVEIYMFKNNQFSKLLKETLFIEEIYKSSWIDENAPKNEWNKIIVDNNMDFIKNTILQIIITGTKNTYKGYSENTPENKEFKLTNSNTYRKVYFWNKDFQNFSLHKGTITFYDRPAIIVGDTDLEVNSLNRNPKYKILTNTGKILYVEKNLLIKY